MSDSHPDWDDRLDRIVDEMSPLTAEQVSTLTVLLWGCLPDEERQVA